MEQLGIGLQVPKNVDEGVTTFLVVVPPGFRIVPAIVAARTVDDIHEWWRRVALGRADEYVLCIRWQTERALRFLTADTVEWTPGTMHPTKGLQLIAPIHKREFEGRD